MNFPNECVKQTHETKPYKISAYKLVWIFLISSMIGVVIETVFCYIFKGHLECRQGVLFGPFNQVYGFGSVVLAFALLRLKEKGFVTVFFVSALIGGFFEIVCSYVQELVFGSVSWDYTWMPISLFGGRTNILYMLFFGVLGVVYIYLCFPALIRLADLVHNGKGIILTWALAIFMGINLVVTAVVVFRWTNRQVGFPPSNSMELYIDTHYPDEMLGTIFPSMKVAR